MARDSALCVVRLRRRVFLRPRRESVGRGVVVECGITLTAAVRIDEPLAVLHDEIDIRLLARELCRWIGSIVALDWLVMDLGDLRAFRERLAVAGNSRPVRPGRARARDGFVATLTMSTSRDDDGRMQAACQSLLYLARVAQIVLQHRGRADHLVNPVAFVFQHSNGERFAVVRNADEEHADQLVSLHALKQA